MANICRKRVSGRTTTHSRGTLLALDTLRPKAMQKNQGPGSSPPCPDRKAHVKARQIPAPSLRAS